MADAVKAADEALLAQLGYKQVRAVTQRIHARIAVHEHVARAGAKG